MSPIQEQLLDQASRRVRSARPDLAERFDLGTLAGLLDAQQAVTSSAEETLVVAVVHRLELAEWARATCEFAFALDPAAGARWRRSFTRTVFLAGNPANLRERFRFAHVAAGSTAAWTAPGPGSSATTLRRLLKLLDAPAGPPARPDTLIQLPGPPTARHRDLYLATEGCTLAEALVHLNHVLVEAVLDGLLSPGDRLTLRQVPRLIGISTPFAALRVVTEPHHPDRLKAAAGLTEETPVV
ncbi:hypothetical protein F4556_000603 [Kitasatospora gansuensis]|uniref:Uncharacterized protein n=1 Tax=Kitasatospora gansuensis TaxID=258050 RepID=A0A7W7S852_9ACTN|nr:DUF6182 family protein [Kitasatospora gansuensis]MBB4945068.1 hypothetical protein [Kitasatospora gansuensis]